VAVPLQGARRWEVDSTPGEAVLGNRGGLRFTPWLDSLDAEHVGAKLNPCIAIPDSVPAVELVPLEPLRHFVIVRGDLPRGTACAMTVHAAGESARGRVPSSTYAVVLAARSAAELAEVEARLKDAGIDHTAIREPDAPWNGELLAIGITPCDRRSVRKIVSSLPLLK
jgi:hypothetical protein